MALLACWFFAIVLTGGLFYLIYFVAIKGGDAALKRDQEQHLQIVNAARRKNGLPPIGADMLTTPKSPYNKFDEDEEVTGFQVGAGPDIPMAAIAAPPVLPKAALVYASIALIENGYRPLDEAGLRGMVERAWDVTVPVNDPTSTEFVVWPNPEAPGIVCVGGYRFLVHNRAKNYFEDAQTRVDATAEEAVVNEIRKGVAWRGVDLVGGEDEAHLPLVNAYGLLGKLAAELGGPAGMAEGGQTRGLFFPELQQFIPYDTEGRGVLLSENVIESLKERLDKGI